MKFRKSAAAAVALSAVMVCGTLAGCNGLRTTDTRKDYEQVVAEVNITTGASFETGGEFAAYKDVITTSEITKRDLVALFAAQGGSLVNGGYSYSAAFDSICDVLINRQIYLQYAKAYFLENGADGGKETFTVARYNEAVAAAGEQYKNASAEKKALEEDIAGLGYFLNDDEKAKAEYDFKVSLNEALDSQEESVIAAEDDEHDHDEEVRTTPTGVNTEDEDYCAEQYEIYTGTGSRHVAECGEYEPVEGSTVTTRRKAYTSFLNNLRSFALLSTGEDTSEIENLIYYSMEIKSAYESALLQKLNDAFEDEALALFEGGDWVKTQYENKLQTQIDGYKDNADAYETALDGMSDTSFILSAPEAGYGFVINILLPFSEGQKLELTNAAVDKGDPNGNKFSQRADILKNVKATDQRGTWFTGHDDYSFNYTEKTGATAYNGKDDDRTYLFFEDSLPTYSEGVYQKTENGKYQTLKNYYGQYTYNGKVTPPKDGEGNGKYKLSPNKIDIDGFITEMESYLQYAGLKLGTPTRHTADYYGKDASYYYTQSDDTVNYNKVNYEKFVYYEGSVELPADYANELFVQGSTTNKAFSVINELSFAYNTDTAGLNTYLGYAVTPAKTDFVSEFEYASQKVCKAGAGHYIVAPSEYGWHIMYCTFSFTEAVTSPEKSPFKYDPAKTGEDSEGTFSNLFYESVKAQSLSDYSSRMQTQIINEYANNCSTKYEDRYADLSNLG